MMQSSNHATDKSYFAIRFNDRHTHTIVTYAIDTQKLESMRTPLDKLHGLGLPNKDMRTFLKESGATMTDYNDPETGLVYPAATKYNNNPYKVKKITFADSQGKKSDPDKKIPAVTTFIRTGYELRFYKNGEPRSSYLKTCITTEDVQQRDFNKMLFGPFQTEAETAYNQTFKDNYNTFFELLENPQKLIAKPDLRTDQQTTILKYV